MKIAVLRETHPAETRVALTPEVVGKLIGQGYSVTVEEAAGIKAGFNDEDFQEAGAQLASSVEDAVKGAKVIIKINPSDETKAKLSSYPKGACLVGALDPLADKKIVDQYCANELTTFALEWMPRITRAQSMDILSSQSNLAGYRAVIEAAYLAPRAFPLMMTAAGTIAPARVLVLGAGVAGLQAIATAKRLGAVVTGYDVRAAAKEQVESLGATFLKVMAEETGDGQGGYAKEMSQAYQKKQTQVLAEALKKHSIVISTAMIPGKPAPKLITEAMVKQMAPGSIVVDLATATGGNCPLSKSDTMVEKHGVKILGFDNLARHMATDASAMLARNIYQFLQILIDPKTKALMIEHDDPIIEGTLVTHAGQVKHARLKEPKDI